jgi:serine/threonine protein kinase
MCESMYSHKIDEWSVGCILLEMVIGSPPFRGKPECTCQCPQVTHRNFNSDQLARIFLVTGAACMPVHTLLRVVEQSCLLPSLVHDPGGYRLTRSLSLSVSLPPTVSLFIRQDRRPTRW